MTTTTSTSPPSSSSGPVSRLSALVEATSRADGDLTAALGERSDVAWARQVHGTGVVVVDAPGWAGDGDALVTTTPGLRLAVRAADCGMLVLVSVADAAAGGRDCVGVVHAGWRGATGGVIGAAADAVRRLSGRRQVQGWMGACIRSCCYAFGDADLAEVAGVLGPAVAATTADGRPALDLPAALAGAAAGAGVELVGADGRCTACSTDDHGRPTFFSHRARGDVARHGVLACLR